MSDQKKLSEAAQEFRQALHFACSGITGQAWMLRCAAELFDQHTEGLRQEIENLEQKVCDFQAASMLDVGGYNGPCAVEPKHVEAHVNDLRARLEAAEKEREAAANQCADAERELNKAFSDLELARGGKGK